MRENSNFKKNPPQRPSTVQDDFTPGRRWSLSFGLLDSVEKWSFKRGVTDDWNLTGWLIHLNQNFDLKELTNISIVNSGNAAHHWVGFDALNPEALNRIRELQSDRRYFEVVEDRLFSMRYCYKPNKPERLICAIYDYVVFPIWWDANHETYGADHEKQGSGTCEMVSCHHSA